MLEASPCSLVAPRGPADNSDDNDNNNNNDKDDNNKNNNLRAAAAAAELSCSGMGGSRESRGRLC